MFKLKSLAVAMVNVFLLSPISVASSLSGGGKEETGERLVSSENRKLRAVGRSLSSSVCDVGSSGSLQAITTQGPSGFGQACMEEQRDSQSYGCTSNDVRIAGVEVLALRSLSGDAIDPVNGGYTCQRGELIQVDFVATVLNGAKSTRYDAGVFWGRDGDALRGGSCSTTSFTTSPDGLPDLEDPTATPSQQDTCGDMPGQTKEYATICGLVIKCDSVDSGSEVVSVQSCTSYKVPGANAVCSNSDANTFLPGSPSKCKCEATNFGITILEIPPTANPTVSPSFKPTANPTVNPTVSPTANPTKKPTAVPTANPTHSPSESPSASPSCFPPKFESCPEDETINCDVLASFGLPAVEAPVPISTCGNPEVSYEGCCTEADPQGGFFITRTWIVRNTEGGSLEPEDTCTQKVRISCPFADEL